MTSNMFNNSWWRQICVASWSGLWVNVCPENCIDTHTHTHTHTLIHIHTYTHRHTHRNTHTHPYDSNFRLVLWPEAFVNCLKIPFASKTIFFFLDKNSRVGEELSSGLVPPIYHPENLPPSDENWITKSAWCFTRLLEKSEITGGGLGDWTLVPVRHLIFQKKKKWRK